MISFRSHVISIVAVFLALAVGVVLGGGPLADVSQSVGAKDDGRPTAADRADLEAAELAADQGDQVALDLGERAYADGLADTDVAVVLLPGARLDDTVTEQIGAAGGEVGGVVQLEPSLLQPGEKSLVDTLGTQLQAQLGNGSVADGATTYDRIGQLLGGVLATDTAEQSGKGDPTALSDDYGTVIDSLETAGLASVVDAPDASAAVILVVTAAEIDSEADPILAGLASGLSVTSTGTVVASPGYSDDDPATRLESAGTDAVAVTGTGRPSGAVAAVLALVDAART